MSDLFIPGEPGIRTAKTSTPRHVFRQAQGALFRGGFHRIDGTLSRDPGNTGDIGILRPGLLMGKVTSGGLYAPSAYGVTTNAEAAGSTAIEAAAAVVTELVRRKGASGTFKLIGPPSAGGTPAIETVTYSAASGTSITVTAITAAFVAGSIIAPVDGSELPLTFICNEQNGGIQVVDTDGSTSLAAVDFSQLPIGGVVDASQLLPWPADDSTRRWIISELNRQSGGRFVFADFEF
jgi:hypothetical protein